MREWWANVYVVCGEAAVLWKASTRHEALEGLSSALTTSCRIHVRLKPEGAPRRYATELEQWLWENEPETMRGFSDQKALSRGHQWTPEQVVRIRGAD